MTDIDVMPARIGAEDVRGRIEALPHCADATVERCLYYPYFHYRASGRVRWLFGERLLDFACVVDARTGRAASADDVPVARVSVGERDCLDRMTGVAEADRSARRYATHALGKALRILGNFNLSLVARGVIYRPYWVVRAASRRMLVDAVTGEYYPIPDAGGE